MTVILKKRPVPLLALLWGFVAGGCYMLNTSPTPSPAGYHYIAGYYDGGTFYSGASPFAGERITGMASDGAMVAAVGEDGSIAYSRDCVIWTKVEAASPAISFSCLTWGEGVFFAGGGGGQAAWSADGIHWNRGVIGPMNPDDIYGVAAGKLGEKSVFVAVGDKGRICYSSGGPQGKWSAASLSPFGAVERVRAVTYGKSARESGGFVAVGDGGKIAFANDLSGRWYGGRTGVSRPFYGVAFGSDRFTAVGEMGMVKFSSAPQTCNWTSGDGGIFSARSLLGITWDPRVKQFVVYGDESVAGYSEYGEIWRAASFRELFPLGISAAACTESRIVLGGADGTIVYSN